MIGTILAVLFSIVAIADCVAALILFGLHL